MDEQDRDAAEPDGRLAGLFRDAAADAPPPAFDAGDVVAASRRITRRRRSAVAGAVLATLAVAGIGVTAALPGGSSPASVSAAGAPAASPNGGEAPEQARDAGPVPRAVPAPAPAPDGPPLGPGTAECADRQDPALRALVEQALPEVAGAPEAAVTTECRPAGERGVALEVRDGATSGVLAVTYLPPGRVVEPPGVAEPPAAVVRSAPTASGGTVLVAARAERAGDPSPYADRLDAMVAALAPRL